VAQSTKKQWTRPELRQFDTAEEMLAVNGPKASAAELEKLEKLADRMRNSREQELPRMQRRSGRR
jgi:hypothetical protein